MEVKLTGIMNTTTLAPGEKPRYGTEVAPRLNAPYHQHFFNARLDFAIDGEANTVYEVNTRSVPAGPDNPHDNAFVTEVTPLVNESDGQRTTNPLVPVLASRQPGRKNSLGGASRLSALPRERTCFRSPSPARRCSSGRAS